MFRKNLCDKVSRMKILRLLSFSFFRADRRGVLRFFGRRIFHWENRETKSPVLLKTRKSIFFANFGPIKMIKFWSVKFTPDQRAVRKIRTLPCRRDRTELRNGPIELILRFREGRAIWPNIWAKKHNFGIFHFFQKNEIFRKCFAKISVTKFRKWKIWDCYLVRFSALIVVVYSVFSVDAFFTEKIAKQNCLFCLFWKNSKIDEKYV